MWYLSIYRSKLADSSKVGHFQDKKSRVYHFCFVVVYIYIYNISDEGISLLSVHVK